MMGDLGMQMALLQNFNHHFSISRFLVYALFLLVAIYGVFLAYRLSFLDGETFRVVVLPVTQPGL